MKKATPVFIFLLCLLAGSLLFKGDRSLSGEIKYQSDHSTEVTGPFEASNSNSRYALVESIVKYNRLDFTSKLAAFSSPDLTTYGGKYFSIFAPGVSFFAVPFYFIGSLFDMPQIFTYMSTLLISALNASLIYILVKKLLPTSSVAWLGAVIFFFCTNSIVYAQTLTQHQLSITLLLFCAHNLFLSRTFKTNLVLGLLVGMGIMVDIPNTLIILPLLILAVFKSWSLKTNKKVKVSLFSGLFLGLFIIFFIYGWYNYSLTGSFTKIGQNLGRTIYPPVDQTTKNNNDNSRKNIIISTPFNTRQQLQGLEVLLVGNERSWLFYSPILLLCVVGFFKLCRHKPELNLYTSAFASIIVINIVIYSMFGDPWGGWAFGSRYLLPAAAVSSIFVAVGVHYLNRNFIYLTILFVLGLYSIGINLIGAATSTLIPPRQEAIYLGKDVKYTWERSIQLIQNNQTESLYYNFFLSDNFTVQQYVILVYTFFGFVFSTSILASIRKKHE